MQVHLKIETVIAGRNTIDHIKRIHAQHREHLIRRWAVPVRRITRDQQIDDGALLLLVEHREAGLITMNRQSIDGIKRASIKRDWRQWQVPVFHKELGIFQAEVLLDKRDESGCSRAGEECFSNRAQSRLLIASQVIRSLIHMHRL